MITEKDVKYFLLKLECMGYSKLGGYFLSRAVDSTIKRNFGDGERYQSLSEKYYRKMQDTVDKIMEMAR